MSIGLITCKYVVLHIKFVCFVFMSVDGNVFIVGPRGTKADMVKILHFLCYIIRLFVTFSCL